MSRRTLLALAAAGLVAAAALLGRRRRSRAAQVLADGLCPVCLAAGARSQPR